MNLAATMKLLNMYIPFLYYDDSIHVPLKTLLQRDAKSFMKKEDFNQKKIDIPHLKSDANNLFNA